MKLAILSSIRRRLIYYLKKDYIKNMLKYRKGSCNNCYAECCYLTRSFCMHLKDGKCLAYKKNMPLFCKIFPIDNKDIELAGMKDICKFKFDIPMKIPLQNECCSYRFKCKNVNTENCKPLGVGKLFIECNYYEEKQ